MTCSLYADCDVFVVCDVERFELSQQFISILFRGNTYLGSGLPTTPKAVASHFLRCDINVGITVNERTSVHAFQIRGYPLLITATQSRIRY